ncbi:MAG: hypothetical protein V3V05_01455 [Pontiella sp.]
MNFKKTNGISWNLRKFLRYGSTQWILGRYACLGSEVMNRIAPKPSILNFQKARIDLQLDLLSNRTLSPITEAISQYIIRPDIRPLADQQASFPFQQIIPPKYFIMDSFSELTDQLFVHREDAWKICFNWSDLNHNTQFENTFECHGLLSTQHFRETYEAYFDRIQMIFPGISIVYLFFSTALDTRDKFIKRDNALQQTLESMASKYPNVHLVVLPERLVTPPITGSDEYRNFPYHYSANTYDAYAEKTRTILTEKNLL